MEIELPSGCNIFYGTYIDNYQGNVRTRYYIDHYRLVANTTSSNTTRPTGSVCMSEKLLYKPEISIYFQLSAFAICVFVFVVIFKLILRRLWQGK